MKQPQILGVHGVWNHARDHEASEVIAHRSKQWADALASGLGLDRSALDVTYSYWAPILHAGRPVPQGSADPDLALDLLERHDPDAAALASAWLVAVVPVEVTPQGRLAVPLRQLVALAAERFSLDGRLTKLFVARCFSEVARYLTDQPVRGAVRDYLAATIAERNASIVIAHSLGTVVAYEALHAHPELKVDLLITLGSPLALPHGVFQRLEPAPAGGVGPRPPNVGTWVNISDHGDPIAVLRPFKQYFPDVDLDLAESISLFDFHRAEKYLAAPSVAAALLPYIKAGEDK